MTANTYTLEDLSRKVAIHPRTIRSYIQQGLMRGPDAMGRHASYSDYHLKRLEVIKALKDDYALSLSDIRRLLTMAGHDEEIQLSSLLSQYLQTRASVSSRLHDVDAQEEPLSALDFIRARQTRASRKESLDMPKMFFSLKAPDEKQGQDIFEAPPALRDTVSSGLVKVLEQLRKLTSRQPKRKAKGEDWIHLQITPDLAFQIRGPLSPEQLAYFEQLADVVRHILLGEKGDG